MKSEFSEAFHQASKNYYKTKSTSAVKPIPEEWTEIFYKKYERIPKITLGHVSPSGELEKLITRRQSRRNFLKLPITKKELSILLAYGCGITRRGTGENFWRAYPSGGARYPLEIYPLILRGKVGPGLYHYNVLSHALDVLWEHQFGADELEKIIIPDWPRNASILFIITAVFLRSKEKYGELGYRHTLIEAGHIGQNVYLIAEKLGLKCCSLSGVYDPEVEKNLDVDGIGESIVYVLALGK